MPAPKRSRDLTTPDLVLLSLLEEQPMHGYQANLELERRQVRDWAGISRPQVYYSLEKLERLSLLRTTRNSGPAAGPDRRIFTVTAAGKTALADALENESWTTQRDRPAFLTWVALSWRARQGVFKRQIDRRRKFLEAELEREKATLRAVLREVGHRYHEAVWMIGLSIDQCKLELRWLKKVERQLGRRARARHQAIASGN